MKKPDRILKRHWLVNNFDQMVLAQKKGCCLTMAKNIYMNTIHVKVSQCPWCDTNRMGTKGESESKDRQLPDDLHKRQGVIKVARAYITDFKGGLK